jgi:hemolysin activation/secretion protein
LFLRNLSTILAAVFVGVVLSAPAIGQSDPASLVAKQNQSQADALASAGPAVGEPVVTAPAAQAALPAPGGPTVLLRSVDFEPASAFLSKAELDAITARYIGRQVDFAAISTLVRDVNDLYAEKGVVTASALLPPQPLSDGNLRVDLVEGRLGGVSIVGAHRTSNKMILGAVRLTRDGDVVDVPMAADDIVRFNKMHHAQLNLLLQPGAGFGLTDLALGVVEPPPVSVQFSLDNQGVASTGATQLSGSYRSYGMLGGDDNLLFYATASEGSLAGTTNFDMPISSVGTRIALGVTGSSIHVVHGPTAVLDITGQSVTVTATLTQALLTKPDASLIGVLAVSSGVSQSFSADTPLVDSLTTKFSAGVAASYSTDRLTIAAQPQLIYALSDDRLSATRQGFIILAGSASADFAISEDLTLSSRGAWQYTMPYAGLAGMPGSLLFQIGGPGTVRGYPSDGVGGDSGYYVQTELHWAPPDFEGVDLYALADFGEVFSSFPARTSLASVGAGVSYNWQNGVQADLITAIPVLSSLPDQGGFAIYGKLTGSM